MSFLRFASAEDLEHAREYAELLQYVIQFVKQDQHPTSNIFIWCQKAKRPSPFTAGQCYHLDLCRSPIRRDRGHGVDILPEKT